MKRFVALATLGLCLSLAACNDRPSAPTFEVYVLVDLSESWHNTQTDQRNQSLLEEIGNGIGQAAEQKEPPVEIEYRPIGVQSLDQVPLCDARYQPTIVAIKGKRPDYLVTRIEKLKSYLSTDCPAYVMGRPQEALTQISAAINSVAQEPKDPSTRRYIIIASDFYEEAGGPPPPIALLSGSHVLLIYRPYEKVDGGDPVHLANRMKEWTDKLKASGADVTLMPDVDLKASEVADFLSN